jgi:arginase
MKLLGIAYDARSSFMRGPAAAPGAVRRALHCGSANYTTELGAQVDPELWTDLGDLTLGDAEALDARDQIMRAVTDAIDDGSPLLSIGGDHFVTYPIVAAMAQRFENITIIHIDAHPDLYDELDGDRFSHACPFARIMEAGHASRLLQFGIRTITPHQHEQADRFGVEVHEVRSWEGDIPHVEGPVYISIDVDGLDPSVAPGVSHHEPGGLSMRQVLDIIHEVARRDVQVIGADVVEINPERDIHDMTAMVGAKLVRELLGIMA